jgi:hypothetical protein
MDAPKLQWLVVTRDGKIAAKGEGAMGGTAYGFVAYAYDGCPAGRTTGCQPGPDKMRFLTWPLSAGPNPTGTSVYDNVAAAGYDVDVAEPATMLTGSALIQRP